jgi:predicted aspartyl protease
LKNPTKITNGRKIQSLKSDKKFSRQKFEHKIEDGNYVTVRLCGRTIKALIDTGSGSSVMSKDLADKLKIKIQKQKKTIKC